MSDVNSVVLEGRLVEDPKLQYTGAGTAKAKFRLASDQSYMKDDEKKGDVCFASITVWGATAEAVANHRAKGDKVTIVGRLRTYEFDDAEGAKKHGWEVVANSVSFGAQSRKNAEAAAGAAVADDPDEMPEGETPF